MPPAPPALLPGRTAADAFTRALVRVVVAALVLLVLLRVSEALPRWTTSATGLGGGLGWMVLLLRSTNAVGPVLFRELEHGYATLALSVGAFTSLVPRGVGTDGRVPWDLRGVWVLRRDGRVVSAPDPAVDPPGWYPSPSRPGRQELWTGAVWAQQYR